MAEGYSRDEAIHQALKKVNPNTILVADPAFTLERVNLTLPEGWISFEESQQLETTYIAYDLEPVVYGK